MLPCYNVTNRLQQALVRYMAVIVASNRSITSSWTFRSKEFYLFIYLFIFVVEKIYILCLMRSPVLAVAVNWFKYSFTSDEYKDEEKDKDGVDVRLFNVKSRCPEGQPLDLHLNDMTALLFVLHRSSCSRRLHRREPDKLLLSMVLSQFFISAAAASEDLLFLPWVLHPFALALCIHH